MNSATARALTASGEMSYDDACDALERAGWHEGVEIGGIVRCCECSRSFTRSAYHPNTCSDACQVEWGPTVWELDAKRESGPRIIAIADLTHERACELLGASGLGVKGARKVEAS